MNRRVGRPAIAAVEVLLAAAVAVLAVRWWHRGVIVTDVAGAELFRVDGRWWSAAVLVATVAGLVLIDVARRLALALRQPTRDQPTRDQPTRDQPTRDGGDLGGAGLTPPPAQDHR
ncbi:MAG: hypothetical protein GEV09_05760 [Pseudonocardiaceae bacterium]|nr:hypothetical protein [Pseudonocardiaceae bacterium]